MRARLEYQRPKFNTNVNELVTECFEGKSIMFITSGGINCPDYRIYVEDEFVFSISPSSYVSFAFIPDVNLDGTPRI